METKTESSFLHSSGEMLTELMTLSDGVSEPVTILDSSTELLTELVTSNDGSNGDSSKSATIPASAEPVKSQKFEMSIHKIVIALVVTGIILFASFQIRECVESHQNPNSQTSSTHDSRTFPGLMICPFGRQTFDFRFASYVDFMENDFSFCPKWSNDALLSFDFGFGPMTGSDQPRLLNPAIFNTNLNLKSGRQGSNCPKNNFGDFSENQASGIAAEALMFFDLTDVRNSSRVHAFISFVTVKNRPTSRPFANCGIVAGMRRGSCNTCRSWTPPNVRCIVYDPSAFDSIAPKVGIKPICNPMREGQQANVHDTLNVIFPEFDVDTLSGNPSRFPTQGFRYKGLIQQPSVSEIGRADSELFVSFFDLKKEHEAALPASSLRAPRNPLNTTFFDGLLYIFYDSAKGTPTEIDFNSAQSGTPGEGLYSQVLLRSQIKSVGPSQTTRTFQLDKFVHVEIDDYIFDKSFSNVVLGSYKDITTRFTLRFSSITELVEGIPLILRMQFASVTSTLRQETVVLSILTTISIILSTAATVWGARNRIEQFIVVSISKYRARTAKRNQNSAV